MLTWQIGGYVRLNTSNPFDQPLIDPAFLSTDYDVAVMVEAVRASQRYVAASPWKNYIIRPFIDSANTTTVEGIVEYSRQRTATTRHPTGTAQVGKVVNGDLTVKNVNGLRVVDASIFVSARPFPFCLCKLNLTEPTAFRSNWPYSGSYLHYRRTGGRHH